MLINCNSCQKKFVVPDSAITENGRLLQCGSCGNKWTQYPIKEKTISKIIKVENKIVPAKKTSKKKKRQINLYSEEYLRKKHGLTIKDDSSVKKNKKQKNEKYGLGFYGWVLIIVIFFIFIHGILNLKQNFFIKKFPDSEIYINYFFEVHEMIKKTILEFFS